MEKIKPISIIALTLFLSICLSCEKDKNNNEDDSKNELSGNYIASFNFRFYDLDHVTVEGNTSGTQKNIEIIDKEGTLLIQWDLDDLYTASVSDSCVVKFSGDFLFSGTQYFEGTINESKNEISGKIEGSGTWGGDNGFIYEGSMTLKKE